MSGKQRQDEIIDDIAEKLAGGIRLLGGLKEGAQAQVRALVENVLRDFDLVTAERMEVQEAMLRKASEEIEALEKRVSELEARLREQDADKG